MSLLFYSFIVVALVEETSKYVMTYNIGYREKEFDQLYDIIVYSTFVSLGFALLENILYIVINSINDTFLINSGIYTASVRAFSAIPAHASFGVIMGYFLGKARISQEQGNKKNMKKYFALSLFVPVIMHGIYDFLLLSGSTLLFIIFILFLIFIITFSLIKLNKLRRMNIVKRKNYCPNCSVFIKKNYCPKCGKKIN